MVQAHHSFTFPEYLRVEEESGLKHEFLDGRVWAMAGGTPEHAAIAANIIAWLSSQLRGRPCRVFSADLRIRVLDTGLTTYPDVAVVCERLEVDAQDPSGNTVTNPVVLVEVLSPSTEDYDRGEKLAHYKRIPALQEVLLVAHDEQRLEVWRRTDTGWSLELAQGTAAARLRSLQLDLPVDEVYRNPL
ncbi:MAG: Uma2 family endonuclease [Myxococcales bacterium]|nr:Uma2 family endonuclease [Myxococcales bacterium]MCB9647612.1 Uma2 family endonuclease [Deltaproteobacteria bacterium]